MRTPPGVSAGDFSAALDQFAAAVGKAWVFTSDEDVGLYRDAYSPFQGEPEEKRVSAAVAPGGVEQVQAVVRTANRYRIPIYPISTGKNLGYGGSAPVLSGSVVLDLKRMNRVLEVNEKNASALVEPGVSYFDFYRHLQDHGLTKVWMDCPDPGWGSLIGNALDRGGGYTRPQFRNHFDAHCGMEVVLANGELMRTGMGALPGARTWQQYKSGFGPWIDGMFSQSNFGIVTKMGFWLMPAPEAYLSGTVLAPRHDDLIPLIDTLNFLENSGICNGITDIGSPLLDRPLFNPAAARDPQLEALLAEPEPSVPKLDVYATGKGIPYWRCTLKFYGPAKVVAAQWEHAKEQYRAIPGVTFEDGELLRPPLSPEQMGKVQLPEFGIPSLSIFSVGARSEFNQTPTSGHIWFSPIIPRTGEAILEANRVFAKAARELELPNVIFSPPFCFWERSFVYIIFFPITPDPKFNQKTRANFHRMVQIAAEHGWGEYRTASAYYDDVMRTYSFNDHALLRFHETVKDAIDPNGILSAGRYGIWPRHLRDKQRG